MAKEPVMAALASQPESGSLRKRPKKWRKTTPARGRAMITQRNSFTASRLRRAVPCTRALRIAQRHALLASSGILPSSAQLRELVYRRRRAEAEDGDDDRKPHHH